MRLFGSDGRTHLDYDLILQNVFDAPVTVTSIEVLDPAGTSLLTLGREEVAAATGPILSGATPTAEVAANSAVATVMDVVLPTGAVPERLTHRITYVTGESPSTSILGGDDIHGPDLVVDSRVPLTIGSPVRGSGWLNASSCCAAESAHRKVRLAVGGNSIKNVQEFAIDWTQLRDGKAAAGDGAHNEDYYAYGADLVAVADGSVAAAVDGMPNQAPNTPRTGIQGPQDYPGNHVSLEVAPGVWAVYAHLQPGSITVKPGDKVTRGQVIGKLGNSGNSGAPHLHFQLADGPDLLNSSSLPFSLESYRLLGSVDPAMLQEDDPEVTLTGPSGPQQATYPLVYTVIDVGSAGATSGGRP